MKIQEIIDQVNLRDLVNDKGIYDFVSNELFVLSGGEAHRVSLTRAIFNESEILLLDEITSALDKETTEKIEEFICSMNNTTVLYVSHKINEKMI